jgi:vancomycin resistance protein YoaR
MTDEQKMKWQTEQDAITLDFSKWSQQRTRAGLSNSHGLWEEQRDDVLSRQQSANAESRRNRLAGLEAAKNEKRREHEREIDVELEPTKLRLKRDWLANNPSFTESDFEKKAWHLLRENLIEQRKTEAGSAEIQALKATGRYAL